MGSCWTVPIGLLSIETQSQILKPTEVEDPVTYLWLVGNGRMVVIVVIVVPHSSIPY